MVLMLKAFLANMLSITHHVFHVFRHSKLSCESVCVVQKSQMQLSLAYTFMIMLSAL